MIDLLVQELIVLMECEYGASSEDGYSSSGSSIRVTLASLYKGLK